MLPLHTARSVVSRSWYSARIDEFRAADPSAVLGTLVTNSQFADTPPQKDAWKEQIRFLQDGLSGFSGSLFLEFEIPRMGRRVDLILVLQGVVVVVEFKTGEVTYDRGAIDQAWDYALDLKNFHEASHDAEIVPILVPTLAPRSAFTRLERDTDGIYRPLLVCVADFAATLTAILTQVDAAPIDVEVWARAPYKPTPTIVEAARALYARHSVEAIARFDAGARNLSSTSRRIEQLVAEAQRENRKCICFVTGVPGAGKTLVGLNVATRRDNAPDTPPAVFLSGNDPLVNVLREALTRDELHRRRLKGDKVRKGVVGSTVKAFIQNVHHFRDDSIRNASAPAEHVVVFDEAQRAWNLRKTSTFMQRKKGLEGFDQSEPEFLVGCVDRHPDWAVVVCLVGGGQEIHDGEAGIGAWIEAINRAFPDWYIYVSSQLSDSEYAAGGSLDSLKDRDRVLQDDALHLPMSMRSFRAETVSRFVKALLDCDREAARGLFSTISQRYPIVLTRKMDRAKSWIRDKARGSERYGLVASSRAQRLKPLAIDVRVKIDPVHWFLNGRDDTRSSYFLEDAATEFQVQGLELDWVCVSWDGDLRFASNQWRFHEFRGDRWCNVRNADNRGYQLNAYRVLLTRARQGMVLLIPEGDDQDRTREPAFYDATFDYLTSLGLPVLS